MQKIVPFESINEAISTLDNGGHFYNLFTKANDGVISKEELGKVGGLFLDKQQMILYFELAISGLSEKDKNEVRSKLSPKLMSYYKKYKPNYLSPAQAQQKGEIAGNIIIKGVPFLQKSHTDISGFVMIPVLAENVNSFTMVPIINHYDVYELKSKTENTPFIIAHTKGEENLPEQEIQVAGILKELKKSEQEPNASGKFLEALYWTER